ARHGVSQVGIGTVAYRDPYLIDRGAWDFAADRWSAAITLHEMLTGTRPSWSPQGASPRDPAAELVLAAERFDASVRDRLVQFFTTALKPEAAERHTSAARMRSEWKLCFAASVVPQMPAADSGERNPPPQTPVEDTPEADNTAHPTAKAVF